MTITTTYEKRLGPFRVMWFRHIEFGWLPRLHVNPYDPPTLWLVFTWGKLWLEYSGGSRA